MLWALLAKMQMVLVYNVNFGPWLSACNLGQKREVLQEYMQINKGPPEDRRCNFRQASTARACTVPSGLVAHLAVRCG